MRPKLIYGAILLVVSPLCTATENGPAVGSFGFDWLCPRSAQCQAISETLVKRFRRCERQPGAFGLNDPLYVCRIDDRTEYMIFETRSICVQNLERQRMAAPLSYFRLVPDSKGESPLRFAKRRNVHSRFRAARSVVRRLTIGTRCEGRFSSLPEGLGG